MRPNHQPTEERTMAIEKRESEDMTAFTIRRIRAEILEQAAKAIETEPKKSSDRMYRAGRLSAALKLRQMAQE
jgi:hypothetical protein